MIDNSVDIVEQIDDFLNPLRKVKAVDFIAEDKLEEYYTSINEIFNNMKGK